MGLPAMHFPTTLHAPHHRGRERGAPESTGASYRRGMFVAAVLCLFALPACDDGGGDDGATDREALPAAPLGTAFTSGAFDDVPVFRGATPLQGPSSNNGAITASYETKTASPEQALRFYEANLPALGWEVADPIAETSESVWRGDWIRDGRRLQISALPFSAAEDSPATQFSLVLLDDTADIPVGATIP